jgi:CRISPR-associated exonuclease Cas4
MTWIRVSDVRQFAFCPRVIWHRGVNGQPSPETPKMEQGRHAEAALAKLEKRRGLRRYRLETAKRQFSVQLESSELGVCGICDLVLEVPEASELWPRVGHRPVPGLRQIAKRIAGACHPVEVKTTRGGVSRHHVLQLAGYSMLLSEATGLPVETGFVVVLPDDRVTAVTLGDAERQAFLSAVSSIRELLASERFPEPTRYRSFCPDCEYVNFCGDVL